MGRCFPQAGVGENLVSSPLMYTHYHHCYTTYQYCWLLTSYLPVLLILMLVIAKSCSPSFLSCLLANPRVWLCQMIPGFRSDPRFCSTGGVGQCLFYLKPTKFVFCEPSICKKRINLLVAKAEEHRKWFLVVPLLSHHEEQLQRWHQEYVHTGR